MTSNLECVGLRVADSTGLEDLVEHALAHAQPVGGCAGVHVVAWQDSSGARLVLGLCDGGVLDLLPSFAGEPTTRLSNLHAANEEVAIANVTDEVGETVTMLAVELEERRLLPAAAQPVEGLAAVVALGVDVRVHADAGAFSASDASLLTQGHDNEEPPPHFAERGWSWPPRVANESFISYGVFGEPAEAEAYARLNGTVLRAEAHTTEATGQSFTVARVRTAGFEVDMCLPAMLPVPQPGNIIGGTVFLVASLPSAAAQSRPS